MWVWLTCQFSEAEALNVTKLAVEQGEVDAGFVHASGMTRPLAHASIDTRFAADGSPKALHIVLHDRENTACEVDAEVLRLVALPIESPDGKGRFVMYETLARYQMGDKTGYGIA